MTPVSETRPAAARRGPETGPAGGPTLRVVVAGGAGFIGSHVCDRLLALGHEVICLDNFVTGRQANVDHHRDDPRFRVVSCDVVDAPDVECDLVLHLASPASPVDFERLNLEIMKANAWGAARLLDLAVAHHARFLFASTSEVYGEALEHPQRESYRGNVSTTGPRACYDESKRFGEALLANYRTRHGLNASIVRIFNTYGPRMRPDDGRVIPAFVNAVLDRVPLPVRGSGTQTRSFCYVSDLVEGLLTVALDRSADGEIFNVGNPDERSIKELAERMQRVAGVDVGTESLPGEVDSPSRRCPDITKIRDRYGWTPAVSLDDGLRHTLAHYRAEREAAKPRDAAARS